MKLYRVWIVNKSTGDGRSKHVVTDTFQNACNLARANCAWNEEVQSVNCDDLNEVIVDFAAAGVQDPQMPFIHPRAG